jgi:hypothetical protein
VSFRKNKKDFINEVDFLKTGLLPLTLSALKVYLHVSPILHLACRFTTLTIYFYILKWSSLLRNLTLKLDV